MVGLELEVISRKVDRFGWDAMNGHVRQRLIADWISALADFTLEEIGAATREILAGDPREAVNEQKVCRVILRHRARRLAAIPMPPEPERQTPTPEAKARVDAVVQRFLHGKEVTPKTEGNTA